MKTIDARGLSCPEPVIMTRKALSSGEQSYEVLVDNPASRENVTRYAEHQGYSVSVTEQDGEYTLSLRKA
ncbi:MAG: sulfurtransferase TusA family protein [Stomatobaculum sp.]|jgi:TusA-related sulfurtransferase|nr:sulfurtransferase TusA family protein [Stomatobaculum sp.]MBR7057283.1 sulfurtransferase TusA family protein [Stomatobaculum sp.]